MSTGTGCSQFPQGCMCSGCASQEVWEQTQGMVHIGRAQAKAAIASSVAMPKGCPSFNIGCMCQACKDRQSWYFAQSAARVSAPAVPPPPQAAPAVSHPPITSAVYIAAIKAHLAAYQDMGMITQDIDFARVVHAPTKLPPMNCIECNHRNEFVGPEHLVNGGYICRQCRPRRGLKVVGT